jgi:hypothetical protein
MSSSPTTVWRRHDAMPAEGLRSAWKNIAPLKSRKLLKSIGRAATVAINISWHQVYHETSRQAFEFCRANSRPQELEAWARGDRTLENVDRTSRQEIRKKESKGKGQTWTMPQRKSQRLNTFVLPPFRRNVQTIDARKVGITTGSLAGVDHPIRSGCAISCRKGNSLDKKITY